MAYAGMDYHMDFISLLSLANIGVVDPEVSLSKTTHNGLDHLAPPDGHGGTQVLHASTRGQLNVLSSNSSGEPLHSVNGTYKLYKGLTKRRRDQVESVPEASLEATGFPDDVQYVIKVCR